MSTQAQIDDDVNYIVNQYTNQSASYYGTYQGQCTVPVAYYVEKLTGSMPGMANDRADGWGTNFPDALAPYFTHESFQSGKVYPRGTILMWDSPHIAIVLHSDGSNTVQVFEQNADPDGSPCGTHTRAFNLPPWHEATYALIPIIDAPAPSPPQPIYTEVETYPDGKLVKLNKQPTNLWGMNYHFDYMKDHPVEVHDQGEIWTVTSKVHHEDGYDYYRRDGQVDGFNTLDCDDYTPPPPAPQRITTNTDSEGVTYTAYDTPRQMFVSKVGGAEKWSFAGIKSWRDFKSMQHVPFGTEVFVVGEALHPIPPNGAVYLMDASNFGNFVVTGKVDFLIGFAAEDLSPGKAPAVPDTTITPEPAPAPPEVPVSTPVTPNPNAWKATNTPLSLNRKYVWFESINTETVKVYDLEDKHVPQYLAPYSEVPIVSTFVKDNVLYGRTKKTADLFLWYGVPMSLLKPVDLAEEAFDATKTLAERVFTHTTKIDDFVPLVIARVEKFIDGFKKRK